MTKKGYISEVLLLTITILNISTALICHECDTSIDEFPIKLSVIEKDSDIIEYHFCKKNELGKPKSCKNGEVCGKHFFEGNLNNLKFTMIARVCQPEEEFTSCLFIEKTSASFSTVRNISMCSIHFGAKTVNFELKLYLCP